MKNLSYYQVIIYLMLMCRGSWGPDQTDTAMSPKSGPYDWEIINEDATGPVDNPINAEAQSGQPSTVDIAKADVPQRPSTFTDLRSLQQMGLTLEADLQLPAGPRRPTRATGAAQIPSGTEVQQYNADLMNQILTLHSNDEVRITGICMHNRQNHSITYEKSGQQFTVQNIPELLDLDIALSRQSIQDINTQGANVFYLEKTDQGIKIVQVRTKDHWYIHNPEIYTDSSRLGISNIDELELYIKTQLRNARIYVFSKGSNSYGTYTHLVDKQVLLSQQGQYQDPQGNSFNITCYCGQATSKQQELGYGRVVSLYSDEKFICSISFPADLNQHIDDVMGKLQQTYSESELTFEDLGIQREHLDDLYFQYIQNIQNIQEKDAEIKPEEFKIESTYTCCGIGLFTYQKFYLKSRDFKLDITDLIKGSNYEDLLTKNKRINKRIKVRQEFINAILHRFKTTRKYCVSISELGEITFEYNDKSTECAVYSGNILEELTDQGVLHIHGEDLDGVIRNISTALSLTSNETRRGACNCWGFGCCSCCAASRSDLAVDEFQVGTANQRYQLLQSLRHITEYSITKEGWLSSYYYLHLNDYKIDITHLIQNSNYTELERRWGAEYLNGIVMDAIRDQCELQVTTAEARINTYPRDQVNSE